MIWSSGCSPTRSSTSSWRTSHTCSAGGSKPLSIASVVAHRRRVRARLLLRAERRRPGLHPEDLLPARAAGDRRAVRVRGRRRSTAIRYLRTRRPRARPALLRRDPPVADPRRRRARSPARSGRKASWGHWWVWDEPTLVSLPDRLPALRAATSRCASRSRTPSARRATRRSSRSSAGAFVPLNFIAVRLAESLTHPRVLRDRPAADARRDAADLPRLAGRAWRACS